MSVVRGAALAEALTRLEGRYGLGVLLPGGRAAERQALRRVPFGVASLDALLDGGLAAGEPLSLIGHASSGTLTLARSLVASAQADGGEVAWLDPTRSFDPLAAARAHVDLARLLVVRAEGDALALAATVVVRSSAFVLVVVDLGTSLARPRLSREALTSIVARARASEVSLLVLADRRPHAVALPGLEVRRSEWLRTAGRIVGWRSLATRPHDARVASLGFAPLALPPQTLIDEGVRVLRAEAVG